MSSPSIANRTSALRAISELRLQDSVAVARRELPQLVPPQWPKLPDPRGIDKSGLKRLIESNNPASPDHPLNWHRAAIARAVNQPRVREIYFRMKRNLWNWREFLSLDVKAMRILEIVIELARDEAFPWHVNAKAREVMKLARTNHATFAASLRQLECLVITRPARRIMLVDRRAADVLSRVDTASRPRWPSAENHWCVDPKTPPAPIAQWVIRYRRGVPRNANRAAWWINYDLLCETRRVLPCFEACVNTLARTYEHRNHRLGDVAGYKDDRAFAALERQCALHGPLPPPGLRAALWEGLDAE